jgi:hypothetical protein
VRALDDSDDEPLCGGARHRRRARHAGAEHEQINL